MAISGGVTKGKGRIEEVIGERFCTVELVRRVQLGLTGEELVNRHEGLHATLSESGCCCAQASMYIIIAPNYLRVPSSAFEKFRRSYDGNKEWGG